MKNFSAVLLSFLQNITAYMRADLFAIICRPPQNFSLGHRSWIRLRGPQFDQNFSLPARRETGKESIIARARSGTNLPGAIKRWLYR